MDLGSIRPLAQQVPRRTDDGLVFGIGDRELVIGGQIEAAWDVLGLCDGRLTVDQITSSIGGESSSDRDDVRGLLGELLEHGALVDCTQAYRLLHRQASAGSPLFRALSAEQSQALLAETFAPARSTGEPVPAPPGESALLALAGRRRSAAPGQPRQVSFEELCAILAAAYGRLGETRTVASAGGLYPLAVHVAVRDPLGPLEPGVWWYDPSAAALQPISEGAPELGEVILSQEICDALLAGRGPVVFLSADLERPSRKYANRGYRYALIEAGAAMQNAYLAAAELELPIRAIGGIDDARAARLLELGDGRVALLALLLGR